MPFLKDFGKISQIQIPDGWTEDLNNGEDGELVTYTSIESKEVKLSFYYRGKPLSQRSTENLQKILSSPPHTLDTNERLSVETVLRDAAETEYFDLNTLKTDELNGQKILVAEGFWKLSNVDSSAVFICSVENEGTRIDEIYYLAPKNLFAKLYPIFQNTLNTVQWSMTNDLSHRTR